MSNQRDTRRIVSSYLAFPGVLELRASASLATDLSGTQLAMRAVVRCCSFLGTCPGSSTAGSAGALRGLPRPLNVAAAALIAAAFDRKALVDDDCAKRAAGEFAQQ